MNNNIENVLKPVIGNIERNAVLQFLLQYLKNDKLIRGAIHAAAIKFNVHRSTISHLWKEDQSSKINDDEIYNLSSQKIGKCGRKKNRFFSAIKQNQSCPNKTKTNTAVFIMCW